MTSAVRQKADLVISAGFLLADSTATMAKRFPDTNFAITDYPVEAAPFADRRASRSSRTSRASPTRRTRAAASPASSRPQMAKSMGKTTIGAVGGLKIPPVDIWIAGYRKCAQMAVPGTKVIVGYSQDFVAQDKCKTVAENQIAQGAQVLFQVAGGCGIGTLKAADEANKWGIGVDVDQYNLAKRVLTSGVKRVDNGVYPAIPQEKAGKFAGGSDLVFNLKNRGVGVGKISPAVTEAYKAAMNAYKAKIIAGKLKLPSSL